MLGWPEPNEWSWNGSWTPAGNDFPLDGLFDPEYGDGHDGTPILPPGSWDWSDDLPDMANWRNFRNNIGTFELLEDSQKRPYGWRLVPVDDGTVSYAGAADYFLGSSGVDVLDLGPDGREAVRRFLQMGAGIGWFPEVHDPF